ncbi:hypothetical protein M9H77_04471 [Catharanthus roseus]|uniref:Uncharacterized protein n=1 Tax=Catharanthus roseus TaxID=4058 RepID=A0ACC0CE44_CATRO|nr:hypothetical protein M9H77_04471 [Catharanthus roseus]
MWLVPRIRASSDDVDGGVDRGGCGPIGLRGHRIMLYGGVRPPSGESGGARHRGWFQGRPEAALMCLDSLRLPSCARNPHVGLGASQVVSEYLGSILGLKRWILDKL